jgi:polyphosphate glucokinase
MAKKPSRDLLTLAIDIGGSGIKTVVLNETGQPKSERKREKTPRPATPDAIFSIVEKLAREEGEFDRVSIGFPGVVREGVVETAHNLDPAWIGVNLQEEAQTRLGKPVRALNDAAIQGFGAISGKGVELVITLGTGVGSSLFLNGELVPNLEFGHHPFRRGDTYEEQLGNLAYEQIGRKRWNKRLNKAIRVLSHVFNYDTLYLGGGNAQNVEIELPPNVKVVPNTEGLLGGLALWR